MKKFLTLGIFLCTFNWLYGQVPVEEAELASTLSRLEGILAGNPQNLRNVDVYESPDHSAIWVIKINHLKGKKFEITMRCDISDGKHIGSKDQPLHPWGDVFPTRIYISPRGNMELKGIVKEVGKIEFHKCKETHICIKDRDNRIYKYVAYRQVFKMKHARKNEKYYVSGVVEWRTDTESVSGTPMRHGFILVFGIF